MKNTGGTRSHAPKYIGIFVLLLILLCALPLVASASSGHQRDENRKVEFAGYYPHSSFEACHIYFCNEHGVWHTIDDQDEGECKCTLQENGWELKNADILEFCNKDEFEPQGIQNGNYQHARKCSKCKHVWEYGETSYLEYSSIENIESCKDTDNDGKCDDCGQSLGSGSSDGEGETDSNENTGGSSGESIPSHECSDSRDLDRHLCDDPDCSLTASGFCWDNGDAGHECNECGQVLLNDCVDDDKDHYCDFCPNWLTTCNDARDDIDHLCDMCGGEVDNPEPCWDNTSLELDVDGHTCNAIDCGKKIDPSVKDFCWDYDGDGKCEECGWVIGSEPLPALRPEYRITVNGNDGKVERINETSIVHEVLYVRMSLGYEVSGQSYAVIALLKVDWAEGQVGKLGYFTVPNVQGSGARTGASYLAMIDPNADELTISGAVKDSYGMLIQ